jgi:hypothetical protein
VRRGFSGGLVAIGASFDLSENYINISEQFVYKNFAKNVILLSLSIAHCSNCSRVISAVGGVSYKFRRNG